MPRVVISGYYGFDNTGDEMVLLAIISQLRRLCPDLQITVLSANPARTAAEYGVDAVPRMNPLAVAGAIRRSDLLISGGGSLLQDATSGRTVPYYLGVVMLAQLLKVPVFFYAQGVGPLTTDRSKQLVRRVVNRVDFVTVRDADSANLLRDLGVNRVEIQVTADPVFGLGTPAPEGPATERDQGSSRPCFGFAVRPWLAQAGWKEAVADVAARCVDELGADVVWVPFQPPGDLSLAVELQALTGAPTRVSASGCGPAKMLALIGDLDMVVGMRLHALIAAAVTRRPFVGLSYDPKVDSLLAQYGLTPAANVEDVDADALFSRIKSTWEARVEFVASLARRVEEQRVAAQATPRLALSLIDRMVERRGVNATAP